MSNRKSTVIVDRYIAHAGATSVGPNNYQGLRINALPGLHEHIGSLATEYLPSGCSVLDLASGSGAMCQRLRDSGFHVSGTDYVGAAFQLHESVPFTQADLNTDFSNLFTQRFDAIVASEIIEHLENPRHFAREIYSLLRPGGRLILSTPNVDSLVSKILFLTSGKFLWFEDQQYKSDGHISPITQWQIEKVFDEAGFRFLKRHSFGKRFERLKGSPRLSALVRLSQWVLRPSIEANGEIFVAVLERPASS